MENNIVNQLGNTDVNNYQITGTSFVNPDYVDQSKKYYYKFI